MVRKLGLEFLGVFGLSPVDLVHLAADLDCQFIGTVPAPIEFNPEGFAPWSLIEDAALRRDLKSALAERGVELLLGDGNAFLPGLEAREALARQLDMYQDLGVERVNSISFEPDLERTLDQFATFVEMAVQRGMKPSIEFCPISVVSNLATGVKAVKHAGEHARLLLDTMHFFRSGSSVPELAEVADLIGHIQLCDAPREPKLPDYLEEAMYERMIPGDGDAPLKEILAALPNVPSIGLEIPLRSLAEQGIGPHERMQRCVDGSRKILALADRA
ncbi:sugar phosphate isomerase/epimerase family protein [Novosphingobium taihuense]|uniref:Sugar phosphate isomerase/epimerase n=1 Tax=Novosphingobium taihuense TaxID=260085 RepID=A0A7W7AC18_9SPHN|nr:sugar phosphate isomerase/epimerase [Novosphingobium taihuense]MBB4614260.1 sugar phosphate isomerase/epimerase [Novosphingobium taihuense]TWH87107.1 sugar phosphate isomerase/epimerase [Novosphingobium taihuense]